MHFCSRRFFLLNHRRAPAAGLLTILHPLFLCGLLLLMATSRQACAQELTKEETETITRLVVGGPVNEEKDLPIIDKYARVLAEKLNSLDPKAVEFHSGLQYIMKHNIRACMENLLARRPNTNKMMQIFVKRMAAHLKKPLQNTNDVIRINAAMALSWLAESGQEELADAYIEILKDANQNDGVKFHAVRGSGLTLDGRGGGLAKLLALEAIKQPEREAAAITALLELLKREPKFSPKPSKEEVDGFIVFRREIVRALASSRRPALADAKGDGRTAEALARIMDEPKNNPQINPPARIDERLEAAIGLARMRSRLTPDYQPGFAANRLGRFVVDFAEAYLKKEGQGLGTRPWNVWAARLSDALQEMTVDVAGDQEASAYLGKILQQVQPYLKAMEAKKLPPNPALLDAWLKEDKNTSPSKALFK